MDETKAALICIVDGIYDLEGQDGIAAVRQSVSQSVGQQLSS
tara:strand:- start:154 stop:279 length:126 start_codon:yes stop_codon:yes gene_type:complete